MPLKQKNQNKQKNSLERTKQKMVILYLQYIQSLNLSANDLVWLGFMTYQPL